MVKIEVHLEKEQIQDVFESVEVKFTKKKMEQLMELMDNQEIDIKEQLEERLLEVLEEMIQDEWEK